jgi:hypothetical protein
MRNACSLASVGEISSAVSPVLRTSSIHYRKVLHAEHWRYGTRDLAPIESANQPEGPRESQQGYPGVFTDHELCSATPPIQNTGND